MLKDKKKVELLKNTIMLYVLIFSSYIMGFITVPYQTRVFGPRIYGVVGVAAAVMVYFQLVIDFGFLLSATQEVSANREDKKKLSVIFSSITINKLLLILLSSVVMLIVCSMVAQWREYFLFFVLTFISTAISSLMPDYLYRGLEKMETITVRTVLIRLFFTLMIFIVVKEPKDYVFIPVLNIIGNSFALIGVYFHLYKKLGINLHWCGVDDLVKRFKASAIFFFSRIATTLYTATNTVVLDLLSAGTMTGYYTSADKIVATAKSGISPISDSLYPYMIKNRDFKLVRKILLILEPIIIIGCLVVFIFAKPLCVWFFGAEYEQTATILRALLPVVAVILPTYILGFPVLGAMGLNKHANYSTMFGSLIHICQLVLLWSIGELNLVTLGIATSVTETVILIYRIIVVIKNKGLLKGREEL